MPALSYVPSVQERVRYHHRHTERDRNSSGGSRSFSGESWEQVELVHADPDDDEDENYGEDDIDPSDSASRSRHSSGHSRPGRYIAAAPLGLDRQRSPIYTTEDRDGRAYSVHRHHSSRRGSRPARSHSRRADLSDGSGSVADDADYPQRSHHGMPPPVPMPGHRHGGAHGGYEAGHVPYPIDPYSARAMMMRGDAFGGQPNPFAEQGVQNPFAPSEHPAYYPETRHAHRPAGPGRPQSFVGGYPYGGGELVQQTYGYPYGMPPFPGWPGTGMPSPPAAAKDDNSQMEKLSALFQAQLDARLPKPDKPVDPELQAQKNLLTKLQEDLLEQQKKLHAEREADIAFKAAEKAKAIEDARRKIEIADAEKKAKEAAEAKADEAAKKLKEENDKKYAEIEKAKKEADDAKKAAEEALKKITPPADATQLPIRFKDALNRKFSFPYALCKTWKGMELLIKQAFSQADAVGDHVHAGRYDLAGPDGEIILPQVWDTSVKPDWEVTMHLWPLESDLLATEYMEPYQMHHGGHHHHGVQHVYEAGMVPPPPRHAEARTAKKAKGKGGKSQKEIVVNTDPWSDLGIEVVNTKSTKGSSSKTKAKSSSAAFYLFGRAPPKKKK